MSAYAILGATGQTGSSILTLLGESPTANINILVRSRSKLETLYPSLPSKKNIKVFEGNISDHSALCACLLGTRAVFLTIAVNANIPGCTIATDTAKAVVAALKNLKEESKDKAYKAPRLVVLSSASLDDKFWRDIPSFLHKFMYKAAYYIYEDLKIAEKYLREQEDWLSCTFVMPGGLSHDIQRGHELSTERQQTFVGFLDLAGAMIEVADEVDGRWDGQHVSVTLKPGLKGKVEWRVPIFLVIGLSCYWFPWVYKYLPK
jgi:putative NADH-flavin reductase